MSTKTKTQRIEELETEVKALRSLVDSMSAMLHMHFNAGHLTPSTPWVQPLSVWKQSSIAGPGVTSNPNFM